MLKNILEVLAEIMGFLAGMSFMARFAKQVLMKYKVGEKYDKEIGSLIIDKSPVNKRM